MAQNKLSKLPLDYLISKVKRCEDGAKLISIEDLLQKGESNIIVVDGFQFYGWYIYESFNWICGGFKELEELVASFVLAFEKVGAKLVFFFVDGHIDEGKRTLADKVWLEEHSNYAKYAVDFYDALKKKPHGIYNVIKSRNYYHTPIHALSVVLYVLRFTLKCEVHLVDPGSRNDFTAYYARNNKCLALLAEDKFYFFYPDLPQYLSMKHLDLKTMETILYNPEVLPRYFRVPKQHLIPEAVNVPNESILKCAQSMLNYLIDVYKNKSIEYIYYSYDNDDSEEEEEEEGDAGDDSENKNDSDVDKSNEGKDISDKDKIKLFDKLEAEYIRYVTGFKRVRICGPLQMWGLIRERADELYSAGLISRKIKVLLAIKEFCNDCILEDFSEFPPSSYIYQPLRRKLYQILFYEAPQETFMRVDEWCITKIGCKLKKIPVETLNIGMRTAHPGLLQLWDNANVADDMVTKKWKLFSSSISFQLEEELHTLPPMLVIPTAVLFYLCQVIPCLSKTKYKFIESWEVDVFIVQALMLPQITADYLSKIQIQNFNSRALKLIALFTYGCHTMQLLIEVCGNFINKSDVCLSRYFDGKLFHILYEKACWRRVIHHQFSDEASLQAFRKMKQIIWPA